MFVIFYLEKLASLGKINNSIIDKFSLLSMEKHHQIYEYNKLKSKFIEIHLNPKSTIIKITKIAKIFL